MYRIAYEMCHGDPIAFSNVTSDVFPLMDTVIITQPLMMADDRIMIIEHKCPIHGWQRMGTIHECSTCEETILENGDIPD